MNSPINLGPDTAPVICVGFKCSFSARGDLLRDYRAPRFAIVGALSRAYFSTEKTTVGLSTIVVPANVFRRTLLLFFQTPFCLSLVFLGGS